MWKPRPSPFSARHQIGKPDLEGDDEPTSQVAAERKEMESLPLLNNGRRMR